MSRLLKRAQGVPTADGSWPELRVAPVEADRARDGSDRAARALLARARAEAERLRREAWEQGYAAGLEAGLAEAGRRLRRALGGVRSLLLQVLAERVREDESLEAALIELARALAERIVGEDLAHNPEHLAAMVRRAAEAAGLTEPVEVRVHPRDVAAFVAAVGTGDRFLSRVRVVEDPGLDPGDAVLISPRGRVDLRIRRQLERLLAMSEEDAGDEG